MEQEQISVNPAQSDKTTETSYGKFSSGEELLKAYNALEAEFTRRSQRLKEYEQQNKAKSLNEQREELFTRYPIAKEYESEIADKVARSETTGNGVMERALLDVLSSKVKTKSEMASDREVIDKVLSENANRDEVISRYLEEIKNTNAPVTLSKGGAIPAARPYKARSLREAGEIAKKIFELV